MLAHPGGIQKSAGPDALETLNTSSAVAPPKSGRARGSLGGVVKTAPNYMAVISKNP